MPSVTARSPGGLVVFSAEESDRRFSGRLAFSSGGGFSLVNGSGFEEDEGPRCFSLACFSGSALFVCRKVERRRLLALVFRESMGETGRLMQALMSERPYASMN